jgi:excisionase family DNA binding protein
LCPEGEGKMTVQEAASRLEISVSLVYRLVADGRLGHARIGGRGRRGKIIITEEDVRAFLGRCRVAAVDE